MIKLFNPAKRAKSLYAGMMCVKRVTDSATATNRLPWIFIIFLFCSAGFSATYYVATTGSDSNDGSVSSPLKSIAAAAGKVSAGDSIIIAAGAYTVSTTINLTKSGTADRLIYLVNASNERPIFDCSSMSVGMRGIKLGGSYWHIRGLVVKGAGDNGLIIQGKNNIVELCDFLENGDTGCQLMNGAADNKIINCDSYCNRDSFEENADGFSPKMDVGSGNYFFGCRAWQNSDDGWDGYLRGADNVSTRLENCWCFKNGYRKDGSASTGNGNGYKIGGSDNKALKHNFTLVRCLAFQNRVRGFDQNNNRGSMTLYNCTAFNNGVNYSIDGGSSTLTAINCIAAGSGSNSLSGGTQKTNNLKAETSDFVSVDPASAMGPRKADGSLPDITFMHLASGSKLIDAGTVIEDVAYNGSKPDLGCFETGAPLAIFSPHPSPSSVFDNVPVFGRTIMLFDLSGRMVMNAGPMATNLAANKMSIGRGTFAAGKYLYKVVGGNSPACFSSLCQTNLH